MPNPLFKSPIALIPLLVSALVPAFGLVPVSPLQAQTQPATVPASAVVDAARKIISARYVLPDTAARLDAALAAATKRGEFSGLGGAVLEQRINQVLRSVTADGHLNVRYDPDAARRFAAGPRPGPRPVLIGGGGPGPGPGPTPVLVGGPGPVPVLIGGPGRSDQGIPPEMMRETIVNNAGVVKLELLPGNVRYLDYHVFDWGNPTAEAALANAIAFLRDGDAIIIDLRRNGGGSPGAVAAMAGYFLKAGTPLARFEMRGAPGEASAASPAPFSLAGKPVYVLTGKGSFSAAEEFAAHVSAFGFGTLVGTHTGGGAFRNEFEVLPGGFVLSVSVGRPVHALTGTDWEGTGIAPTIATSEEAALEVAQAEALKAVLAKAIAAERPMLERLSAFYSARREKLAASRPLESYAGQYGERAFTVVNGQLLVGRAGRTPASVQALGPDLFASTSNPLVQWRFEEVGGKILAVSLDIGRGDALRIARTGG